MNVLEMKPYDKSPAALNVIVETPRHSRNKFKFDSEKQILLLKRILPAGMVFPFDFGFVPSTLADDGDPLDVMLLTEAPLVAGTLCIARPVGAISAEQTEKGKTVRNDRIVAVNKESQDYAKVKTIRDIGPQILKEFEMFFVNYHGLQGRTFKVLSVSGARQAKSLIEKAIQNAKEK
jgi:inorganic pyrophosphatase